MVKKNTFKKNIDAFLVCAITYKVIISVLITMAIATVIIPCVLFSNINAVKVNKIHCSSVLGIHKDEYYSQVNMTYSLRGDYGLVFIDGDIYKNGELIGFISQRTSFDVKEVNDILLLTSNNTWVTEVHNIDEKLLTGIFPLFYTQKGNYAAISFTQKSLNHYDISTKIIPSMHCSIIKP
ncbi:hypothetical protein ACRBEF_13275 [Yersinia proxima]